MGGCPIGLDRRLQFTVEGKKCQKAQIIKSSKAATLWNQIELINTQTLRTVQPRSCPILDVLKLNAASEVSLPEIRVSKRCTTKTGAHEAYFFLWLKAFFTIVSEKGVGMNPVKLATPKIAIRKADS